MKLQPILLSIFVASFLSACADSSDFSGNQNPQSDIQDSSGIFGGDTVSESDPIAASTVFLKNSDRNLTCSATILSAHTILTASHCVWKTSASGLTVRFGIKGKVAARQVTKVVMHHEYINDTLYRNMNDLAILKIAGELPKGYRPVSLLIDYSVIQVGSKVTVAGYGISMPRLNLGVGTLRKTNLKVGDPRWSNTSIGLTQDGTGNGACFGDSGGPAFIQTKQGMKQFGIANRISILHKGEKNKCNGQSIYTRLDVYAPWIQETLDLIGS